MNTYRHSFIETIAIQELAWRNIQDGSTFEMEIISPLLAKITRFGHGNYIHFLAVPTLDCDSPAIAEGEIILFHMPLKTWEKAMYKIPQKVKRGWGDFGEDNLWLKVVRVRENLIEFVGFERRKNKQKYMKEKEKYYGK